MLGAQTEEWRAEWPCRVPIYPDRELVERAVRNAGLFGERRYRWGAVRQAFGVGSSVAMALCRRFGFDPHQQVGVRPPEADPQ